MEGFKRSFYTTSKKLERKPESNLGQSSFPLPQPFSQSQQPGEEQKQVQKQHIQQPHLIREAKEADEVFSSLGGFGIQSFWPDEYGITHQSGVEPPGRGQEAKKRQFQANGESKQTRRN